LQCYVWQFVSLFTVSYISFPDEPKSIGLYLLNAGHKQVHISVITSVMSFVLFSHFLSRVDYVYWTNNATRMKIPMIKSRMFLWGVIVLHSIFRLFNKFICKCFCRLWEGFLNNFMDNIKCQVWTLCCLVVVFNLISNTFIFCLPGKLL